MIKKFQLGGQQLQLLDQIFAMINLQPEEALKQLAQSGAKPEDIAKIVQVGVQLGKINPEVGKAVMQALQGQVSAARHGMKLQYIKSLKHQCADDEELYYYKVGGKVDCGCKKKGGEIKPEKECGGGAVSKFKAIRKGLKGPKDTLKFKDLAARDSFYINVHGAEDLEATRPGSYKKNKDGKIQWTPDRTKAPYNKKKEEKKHPIYLNLNVSNKKGGTIKEFKLAKCGSKMKKHQLGGSLNGIPFYLGGTSKGGITEKSDNTRVERIPNKGEGVYEKIPINGWDFVPGIGTYREARRLDQEDPNASITRFGISLAGDLAGAGMIGNVAKAAGKASRIQKALKARGYQLFTEDGSLWFRLPKKIIRGYGDKLYTYEIPNIYGGSSFKTIPTVDYAPAVMAPLVLTLRVPAEAPFFNYSK